MLDVLGIKIPSFEGALRQHPNRKGWGIFYNQELPSKGRINFTIAHELGHYLLHRANGGANFNCTNRNMAEWSSEYAQVEYQANTFASFLLMPLDDFRKQISGENPSLDLMRHLADRYNVSLTAAILKWLSITHKRAMIVVAKDGFIDWSWASPPLMRSKIFYKPKQITTELPNMSLAASKMPEIGKYLSQVHPAGVWIGDEPVHEMTLHTKDRGAISILVYPDLDKDNVEIEEPESIDAYDLMSKNLRRWPGC